MKSRSFSLGISPINTKIIIYGNIKIPVDYDLLKRNSGYFRKKDINYSSVKEIPLLKEEKNVISENSIRDFVQCCQTQQIDINSSNILSLNYLAKKYEVDKLLEVTTQYIDEYKKQLAIDSILFNYNMNQNNQICLIDTQSEEDIISFNFEEFIKQKRLLDIPLPVLYRIIQKYVKNNKQKSNSNENQEEKQDLFISFLFDLLGKHGRKASAFFAFLDIDKSRLKHLIELKTVYSDVFDPSFLNLSLLDTTIEIIQETNDLKIEFSTSIEELKNIIEKQKNEKAEIETFVGEQKQLLLDEIHKLRDEIANMKKQMIFYKKKDVIDKDLIDPNDIQYIIPIGKTWVEKSPSAISLKEKDQNYEVKASSANGEYHELKNLFCGKKNPNPDICWRNIYGQNNPHIEITFTKPVKANALLLTSRVIYFKESPTVFEIYGLILPNRIEIFLGRFMYDDWKSYDSKICLFANDDSYNSYKIQFYKSKSEYQVIGLKQLNLCYISKI